MALDTNPTALNRGRAHLYYHGSVVYVVLFLSFWEASKCETSNHLCGGRLDYHDKACIWPEWVS